MTTKSITAKAAPSKPAKPYADFPLYAHRNGQWAKKIRGKLQYFGPWGDWQAAYDLFQANYAALKDGRPADTIKGDLSVGVLANAFLTHRKARVESGDIVPRTLADYKVVIDKVVEVLGAKRFVEGLRPADFEKLRGAFALTHGPTRLGNDIQRARTMFKFADEQFDIQVKFGASFKKPSAGTLRRSKRNKMLDAVTIQAILALAAPTFKAMIYLGINCGFGNSDCATIKWSDLDLERGWHSFPRPKTGKDRRCPLWAETVNALSSLSREGEAVFSTNKGNSWLRRESHDPVSQQFAKLLRATKQHRPGLGFYSLRHTFQTVGNRSGLEQATSHIMGHAPAADDMAANYQQMSWDEQLKAVTQHVHDWLFIPHNGTRPTTPVGVSYVVSLLALARLPCVSERMRRTLPQ